MTSGATEVSKDERRALWLDVLRWPLKGGMLGAVALFAIIAYASAALEGGYSSSAREQRAWGQALVFFAAIVLLGIASWRAVACTYPTERPVPWGRDGTDETPFGRMLGTYVAVLFIAFVPMVVWLTARGMLDAASWVNWLVIAVAAVYAGAFLPLGLAAAVVRGSPLAALPGPVWRMLRAEPRAARIAAVTGIVFVGCLVFSFWLASAFVKQPADWALPGERPRGDPDMVGPLLRSALVALRAAGFYAGIVSCRVAGLLVREVPQIREVLA